MGCEGGVSFVMLYFAGSFLCAVKRRRGVLLGSKREWPSDACYFVFEGGCGVIRGRRDVFASDQVFCFRV